MASYVLFCLSLLRTAVAEQQCLSDPVLNEFFQVEEPTCCMKDVCGLPCPEPVSDPSAGYAVAIAAAIGVSFLIGMATLLLVNETEDFFVAGRSLPLWIVAFTLGAQSIDSNALLGNADLSYKFSFWDGAVLPIGLGLSLIINGCTLAPKINADFDGVLTLPDIYAKRYGRLVEILVSCATLISFMMLLAGNLVGMGVILSYVWGIQAEAGVWTASVIIWAYTVSGGLFSVAYTDVFQAVVGWSGSVVAVFYIVTREEIKAPEASVGFPGYVYPDNIGDGGICDMYNGTACVNQEGKCCYNEAFWCPSHDNCRADNGAYPFGDFQIYENQMTDSSSLSPFPNAIMFNWATIFILAFGNLAALDFQARCMASKTPNTAKWGCIIGGLFTFFVGIPFSYSGSITRLYYGPDSVHAEFEADSCSVILGLPTCAAWVPDEMAFIKYLTHQAPGFIGAWCLFGIVAASMSTADGAILAMGTVFSHNVVRQFGDVFPNLITNDNLLMAARFSTVPFTLASTLIAAYYRGSGTGYLLIVAFDVVLASAVAPLFGCYYTKTPRPNAAVLSIICGAASRIIMEFGLPKDGWLILPLPGDEFLDYGSAASTAYPVFFDEPNATLWDPEAEPCTQNRFEDYTGVDSLSAFLISIVVFVTVQVIEDNFGPMFKIPWTDGYKKVLGTPNEGEGTDTDDSLPKGKEGKTEGVDRESSEGNDLIEVDA